MPHKQEPITNRQSFLVNQEQKQWLRREKNASSRCLCHPKGSTRNLCTARAPPEHERHCPPQPHIPTLPENAKERPCAGGSLIHGTRGGLLLPPRAYQTTSKQLLSTGGASQRRQIKSQRRRTATRTQDKPPTSHPATYPSASASPVVAGLTSRKRASGACLRSQWAPSTSLFRFRVVSSGSVTLKGGRGGRDRTGLLSRPGGGEREARWFTSRTVSLGGEGSSAGDRWPGRPDFGCLPSSAAGLGAAQPGGPPGGGDRACGAAAVGP